MYKNCKTPESAMRQYEFEQCLLHTMKHTAYSNISVTYLCAQIGIARKNFYRWSSAYLRKSMTKYDGKK